VREVVAHVNPHVVTTTGRQRPQSGLEAKFSAHHCVAVALLNRRGVRGEDFTDAVALDPAVAALRERVRLEPLPEYGKEHATVVVTMDDGATYTADVPAARGTTGRPLEDAAVSEKFLGQATPVLGQRRAQRVLQTLWAFDRLPDVRPAIRSIRS
jgi:2-methylcitrate dehydratase PrpD